MNGIWDNLYFNMIAFLRTFAIQRPWNVLFRNNPHMFTLSIGIETYIHFYNTARYQRRLCCMTPMEFHCAYAA